MLDACGKPFKSGFIVHLHVDIWYVVCPAETNQKSVSSVHAKRYTCPRRKGFTLFQDPSCAHLHNLLGELLNTRIDLRSQIRCLNLLKKQDMPFYSQFMTSRLQKNKYFHLLIHSKLGRMNSSSLHYIFVDYAYDYGSRRSECYSSAVFSSPINYVFKLAAFL